VIRSANSSKETTKRERQNKNYSLSNFSGADEVGNYEYFA